MNVWWRPLIALAAGVALVTTSGCGISGTSDEAAGRTSEPVRAQGLKNVDPCSMLSPEEIEQIGLQGPGSPESQLPWAPGCHYRGDPITATFYKNTKRTVGSAANQPVWAMFKKMKINGRAGAQTITKGSTEARICSTMFNAANGTVRVAVSEFRPAGVDECAKSTEIAKMIEPRMPEPA